MAGEIKLNNVSIATENAGTVTINNATLGNSMVLGTNASPIANNLVFANGNGIDFSAAAGSGSSSNVLDDYETGTFTPEVYDASTGGNQLSASGSGSYTKIGDLVTINYVFYNINTTGATSGNSLHFRNLPFMTESQANQGATTGPVRCHGIVTGGGFLTAHSAESTTYARVFVMGNDTADYVLRVQDIGTSGVSDIEFSLTYRAV